MTTKPALFISALIMACTLHAQSVSHVYKTGDLLARIKQPDTTYVLNFWSTWCKPCVQELPSFDSLSAALQNSRVKIILVSLDFKEDLDKKVNPFLQQKKVRTECVLLDEINGNDYINKVSPNWSGAIPATFIKTGAAKELLERKVYMAELRRHLPEGR